MAGPINVPVLLLGPKMGKYGLCLVVSWISLEKVENKTGNMCELSPGKSDRRK